MKQSSIYTSVIFSLGLMATPAIAQDWTLDADASVLSFSSIKNNAVGEAHTFSGLSGGVSRDGEVAVEVSLASLDTMIDIRNERMAEHVFGGAATANLTAAVDMDVFKALKPGESTTMEVEGTLNLLGADVPVYLDMFVLRVSGRQVLASTNTATYLTTDDLGVDAGVDVLRELASLDQITRVTPVTLRFMFTR